MASKDLKPKRRLGKSHPGRSKLVFWSVGLLVCGGGLLAAYRMTAVTQVQVAVTRVRRADLVVTARARGDIKTSRSDVLRAPQAPDLRITHLTPPGTMVRKGEVIVEFDGIQQEQNVLSQTVTVSLMESALEQLKAGQRMSEGADVLTKMGSEYNLERSKLDASKAEVLSQIDGEKSQIKVEVQEGDLQRVKASISAHDVGNQADEFRMSHRKNKAQRDLDTINDYLASMQLKAPADGVVTVLGNFRSRGSFGRSIPPFKEGDTVWPGAEIAEIPNLAYLYVDLKMEEADRGKLQLGQITHMRADAVPEKDLVGKIDFINPIAVLVYRGGAKPDKIFPARVTLNERDARLRPGMSVAAEIVVDRVPNSLIIPTRSTFEVDGQPAAYVQTDGRFVVRHITLGRRNDEDVIVTSGLAEGETVTLESPSDAAKRARKKS